MKGNKDNVWSVDNELSQNEREKERASRRMPRGKRLARRKRIKPGGADARVVVSGAMLMEVETVLQTQVLPFLFSLELWGASKMLYSGKFRDWAFQKALIRR